MGQLADCQLERDTFRDKVEDLEAVNVMLLEALEWFSNRFHTNAEVAKSWAGSCSMSGAEWQDWEVRLRAAIQRAKEGK
ncbi:hypothetical protein LCGC14_2449580 [marine sediment metagenome]|uniref:Uncharacterized protein n=1 Tax=marine sediment metagenome TaxID=412755 RepID=A0A0F9EAE8_9ZZZZ